MTASRIAIVLTGGGARAAYQIGVLQGIARRFPDVSFDVVTGVSAGAINAMYLAAGTGSTAENLLALQDLWENLEIDHVFRVDSGSLPRNVLSWGMRLLSGGHSAPRVQGLVDTSPLRALLERIFHCTPDGYIGGIEENLARGGPAAVAVTTLDYSTGRTVTWIAGDGGHLWERPMRRSVRARFTIDHVMASAALPILFPAVKVGNSWHGDGGIRLAAPLSPALHLGADRIIAISTRFAKTFDEAEQPQTIGYPPPAQILGQLMNAVFLDALDEDALSLERSNALLRELPPEKRGSFRLIDLLVIRPSVDLGKLAGDFEPRLPRGFRFLMRGLGTRETSSPDFLSLLMFQKDYLRRLLSLGEADATSRLDAIGKLLASNS
ncbi:MAG TPA: patatin-like phospholipase family protein [Thermoanaerobaculia bacterium]|nr:patatin-like phospholipase family protein [Thermoanaerobaculia bacterium]